MVSLLENVLRKNKYDRPDQPLTPSDTVSLLIHREVGPLHDEGRNILFQGPGQGRTEYLKG